MPEKTIACLVRHASVHNPGELFYGRLPGFPLSEEGRREALQVAEYFKRMEIAAIFSSPLERAQETAEVIREHHKQLTLQTSELLNEVHTPFDGRPSAEVADRDWDLYTGVDPKYEQPRDVVPRR